MDARRSRRRLGHLAVLLSFIPNLGPILATLAAILLAFAQGPQTAAGVQVVESYGLDRSTDRTTIYLPPAFTIAAQLIMALFAGLLSVTLSTPLAVSVSVLVAMRYVQDVLGPRGSRVRSH